MSYSAKRELIKYAAKLAKEKHPEGFNKAQLIEASKEVFGGHAANPLKPVRTEEDIGNKRNAMALIDGNYPLGMSDCFVVGINGGCGFDCPVFLRLDCEEPGELETTGDESEEALEAIAYYQEKAGD